MAKRAKTSFVTVSLGPSVVPLYPVTAFSRFPRGISFRDVWTLVGPTVDKNLNAPLWAQFCAVYLEGMNHALGAMRESNHGQLAEPAGSLSVMPGDESKTADSIGMYW